MNRLYLVCFCLLVVLFLSSGLASAQTEPTAPSPEPTFELSWDIVVNNAITVPNDTRVFNSYNQPSINTSNFVVFRARSRGGNGTGEPAHGVYTRDMNDPTGGVEALFDRTTRVAEPNNTDVQYVEPPAFARVDMFTKTIASRGAHAPVWTYTITEGTDSRAGTTGIYTNPYGSLIAGGSNVGGAAGLKDFKFFMEPTANVKFDVFPGAPAITNKNIIAFKGNYTVPDPNNSALTISKTGVYYRILTDQALPVDGASPRTPGGGTNPVVLVANSDTLIPGTKTRFGSTAPPSAAANKIVFAGFDNEDAPTLGGIFVSPIPPKKNLDPAVVKIGGIVPGEVGARFNKIGEGLSFDGRFIAFWGAWGTETRSLLLMCPAEGNKQRQAFCLERYPNGFEVTVPVHQGIFVYDTSSGTTLTVAKTGTEYTDFVYWNFSGLVPGTGESDETGEPARWRSASFVAVSGLVDGSLSDSGFHTAFKARTGSVENQAWVNPTDGIYLIRNANKKQVTVPAVKSGWTWIDWDKQAVYINEDDPTATAVPLPVTEMGLERDGFRGKSLAINVSMGNEDAGWAGIYLTKVPQ